MRLRPYFNELDYAYLKKWINDERVHALWCAGLIDYPLAKENLNSILKIDTGKWGEYAYMAQENDGTPVGFFCYSVNHGDNTGFLRFVAVDPQLRGKGYGTQMIKLALKYAFDITGVSAVRMNVFDVNNAARKCYEKAGFKMTSIEEHAFRYQEESWGRCGMTAVKESP